MNRRSFLSALAGLPIVGRFIPQRPALVLPAPIGDGPTTRIDLNYHEISYYWVGPDGRWYKSDGKEAKPLC